MENTRRVYPRHNKKRSVKIIMVQISRELAEDLLINVKNLLEQDRPFKIMNDGSKRRCNQYESEIAELEKA